MSEVIEQNWIYIMVGYVAVFGFFIYQALFAKRGKIKVRVKTPFGEWVKWCKPELDGKTIVVEKPKAKKAGWKFEFTNQSLVPFKSWGRQMFAVDVYYQAPKAIEYDYTQETTTAPKLTLDDVKKIATWDALKARYARITGPKIPTWFMLLTIVLLVVNMILLLVVSGRVKLG
jgi:hypothetical protein